MHQNTHLVWLLPKLTNHKNFRGLRKNTSISKFGTDALSQLLLKQLFSTVLSLIIPNTFFLMYSKKVNKYTQTIKLIIGSGY